MLEARRDEFTRGAATAHRIVALDDGDLQTGFGQICRTDQPVVSAAYDDAIVFHRRLSRSLCRTVLNVPSREKACHSLGRATTSRKVSGRRQGERKGSSQGVRKSANGRSSPERGNNSVAIGVKADMVR